MNRKFVDLLCFSALLSTCSICFSLASLPLIRPAGSAAGQLADRSDGQTSALRKRPYRGVKRVTLDFVKADLVYVVKLLAREMGRNVFIGPGVEGEVNLNLKDVPADAALALVLQEQGDEFDYKLIGYNTLIVARREKVEQIEEEVMGKSFAPKPVFGMRQEILLKRAPAAKVIELLRGQYKDVEFIPHPTMNGFYTVGKRADILSIKNDIPQLDRTPSP